MKARSLIIAVVVALVCLSGRPAAAQVTWEAGFKGGLGLGKLTGDTGFSESLTDGIDTITLSGDISDFRTGFVGGGFATGNFNDAFGIRLEVLYAQKGGTGSVGLAFNGVPAGSADITFKLDYIEIPILGVGSFPAGGATRMNVFGGPVVAFNTNARIKAESQGQSDEQDLSDVEGTDFGFSAGAGVTISASRSMNVVIDGRYTFGLTDIPSSGGDLKNSCLAFTAGFSFPLGGAGAAP